MHRPATTWAEALDLLDRDLALLEHLPSGTPVPDVEPWTAPTDLGPLPEHLAARARALLARQQDVLADLTAALAGNRQQARVADSVRAATGTPDRPAYLDVRA